MSMYKNTSKDRKLLDEVRDVMRLHHYSIHTERTYCDWIKRYIRYHSMTNRQDLIDGEAKIEAFLTHLAVDKNVSPSTQNQAMNALVFLGIQRDAHENMRFVSCCCMLSDYLY